MQKQYQTLLVRYITEGGEPDLELAYEFGRAAISQGTSVLQVIDAHYEALTDVLNKAKSAQECATIVQRAASLLKEALGPFEMTHRGYTDTIAVLRNQNEQLTKLMEERSALLQQREDFMMVVTHDLKTPINAADRCLMLMLEGDFGELSPDQREVLATMKESNLRMSTMVKNLLEAYRYDQQTPLLHLREMDARTSIAAVIKAFELSAQMREIDLQASLPDQPLPIFADDNALQHVLTNLIDNGMKFTPNGGTICVSASIEAEQVEIKVKDTGKGISEEDIPKLFRRFFQSETGRKQYTGTGLGLYLCHQIVTAHGGRIDCESKLGKGTSFKVRLPVFRAT